MRGSAAAVKRTSSDPHAGDSECAAVLMLHSSHGSTICTFLLIRPTLGDQLGELQTTIEYPSLRLAGSDDTGLLSLEQKAAVDVEDALEAVHPDNDRHRAVGIAAAIRAYRARISRSSSGSKGADSIQARVSLPAAASARTSDTSGPASRRRMRPASPSRSRSSRTVSAVVANRRAPVHRPPPARPSSRRATRLLPPARATSVMRRASKERIRSMGAPFRSVPRCCSSTNAQCLSVPRRRRDRVSEEAGCHLTGLAHALTLSGGAYSVLTGHPRRRRPSWLTWIGREG